MSPNDNHVGHTSTKHHYVSCDMEIRVVTFSNKMHL